MEVDQKNISELPISMNDRWKAVEKKFLEYFGRPCNICVYAPGRVNLIGEHIDYSGYGVMPIATNLNVLIAASFRDDQLIHICNIDSNYPDYKISIHDISINREKHAWYNYILCGIKGLLDANKELKLSGMSLAVSGNVPPGCGLSSSSALVCAATLATVKLHGLKVEKFELAKMCAHSERLIGMEGGGMDQAASFLSKEGYATLIEFSPLRTTSVQLPKGCKFVVANSLVVKDKACSSDYNQRVMECRLASFILAKVAGLQWRNITTLGDLQKELKKNYAEMVELVEKHIHKEPYTQPDLCSALEISKNELHQVISPNTKHIPAFYLHRRATHVFLEAERVYRFKSVCDKLALVQEQTNINESLVELGELMYASHASLKDLFECSHEKLDRLVDISRSLAYGARLTGAGWGGCVVALVPEDQVETYVKLLKKEYYSNQNDISSNLFSSSPASGACSFTVKNGCT